MLKKIIRSFVMIFLILMMFSVLSFAGTDVKLDYLDGYLYSQVYNTNFNVDRKITPVEFLITSGNVVLVTNKTSNNYMYTWNSNMSWSYLNSMAADETSKALPCNIVDVKVPEATKAYQVNLSPTAGDKSGANLFKASLLYFEQKSDNSVYIYMIYPYSETKLYLNIKAWEDRPIPYFSVRDKTEFTVSEDTKQHDSQGMAICFKTSKYDCWLSINENGLTFSKTKTSLVATTVKKNYYVDQIYSGKEEIVSFNNYSLEEIASLKAQGKKGFLTNPGNYGEGEFHFWSLNKSTEVDDWSKQDWYFPNDYLYGPLIEIGQCVKLYANYKYDLTITPSWTANNIQFDILKTSDVYPTINSTVMGKKTNSNSYTALENDTVYISYPGANSFGYQFDITTVSAIDSNGNTVNLNYEKTDGGRTIKFKMPQKDIKINLDITYSDMEIPQDTLYAYLNVGSDKMASYDYQRSIDVTKNTGITLSLSKDPELGQPKGIEIVEFKVNTSAESFSFFNEKTAAKSEPDTETDTSSYSYSYQWKYKIGDGQEQNLGSKKKYGTYEIKNLFSEFGINSNTTITVWCEVTKYRDNSNNAAGRTFDSAKATINYKGGDIGSAYVFNIGSEYGGRLSDYVGISVLGLCVSYDANNKIVETDDVFIAREAFWKDATCTVSYNGGPAVDITDSKVGYSGTYDFDDRDYHEYKEPGGITISYTIKGPFFKYLITKNGTYTFTVKNAQGTEMSTTYEYKGIVECEPYFFDVDNVGERTEDTIFINTSPGSVYRSITKCEVKKDDGDWQNVGSDNKKGDITGDNIASSEDGVVTYQSYNGKCYIYKVTENGTYTFRLKDVNGYYTSEASITYNNIVSKPDSLEVVVPEKTEYELYEELDLTGISVTAIYLNPDARIDVTSIASISGFDSGNAGTQTLVVSALGTNGSFNVTVKKSPARMETPEFAQGLIDDGTIHQLLTPADVVGGEIYYAFGQDAINVPTSSWSKDIPKASSQGTYYIWYKLVADSNHIDIDAVCAEIIIAKRPTISFETNGGTPLEPITVNPKTVISSLIGTTTKENAFFARWYTDENLTKVWDSSKPVSEDMTLYAKWVNEPYSVSGYVIGDDLDGAEIRLLKNGVLIKSYVLTSEDIKAYSSAEYLNTSRGAFRLGNDITADKYCIEVYKGSRSASSSIIVKSDVSDYEIELLKGVNMSLDHDQDAPEVLVNGLENLAQSIKSENSDAATIEITLNISEKSGSELGEVALEIQKASAQDSLQYLDFSITQMVGAANGNVTKGAISDTGNSIIAITVLCDTSNKNINIYRYHNGEVEKFTESSSHGDGTYEIFDGYIIIYTNKFSIYAIESFANQITITAGSASKIYDGKSLTAGYTYTQNILVSGDVLTATAGGITNAGEIQNCITEYKIMRGVTDVTNEYDITTVSGILHVSPRAITITSASVSKVYDGTPLTSSEIEIGGDGFVSGEAVVTTTGSQTSAGNSTNTITITGSYNPDNYVITKNEGTLTVSKKSINVKADNKSSYVGSKLVELTYTSDKLCNGDYFTGALTTSAIKDSAKTYDITQGTLSAGENYTIIYTKGTYTVIERTQPSYPSPEHHSEPEGEKEEEPGYMTCPQDETCVYASYPDADTKKWYHDGVHFCVENKYMNGYTNGLFGPDDTLSRAMVVQILYNLEGKPTIVTRQSFTDVNEKAWYADAIAWAKNNNIVDGYGNGLFGPNDSVTREQLATIYYRYSSYKGYNVSASLELTAFKDANLVSGWAVNNLKWAIAVKLMQGNGNGILDPKSNATRAQAATMLKNFCENVAK